MQSTLYELDKAVGGIVRPILWLRQMGIDTPNLLERQREVVSLLEHALEKERHEYAGVTLADIAEVLTIARRDWSAPEVLADLWSHYQQLKTPADNDEVARVL